MSSMSDFEVGLRSQPGPWPEKSVAIRIPTRAFGREFTHIPEHVRQDLETLERECVIYSDQWVEELADFRHVRIAFTEGEAKDFARRSWAYELFLRAQPVVWAKDVPAIDPEIAQDADTYKTETRDGL